MGLAEQLSSGFTEPTEGKSYIGWPVDSLLFLVYEPAHPVFWVHLTGIHKLQPRSRQILAVHRFTEDQRREIRAAITLICEKLADHGLQRPQWQLGSTFVKLGSHVRDRDYVLVEIAKKIKENLPGLEVELRFAGTTCINNCCR